MPAIGSSILVPFLPRLNSGSLRSDRPTRSATEGADRGATTNPSTADTGHAPHLHHHAMARGHRAWGSSAALSLFFASRAPSGSSATAHPATAPVTPRPPRLPPRLPSPRWAARPPCPRRRGRPCPRHLSARRAHHVAQLLTPCPPSVPLLGVRSLTWYVSRATGVGAWCSSLRAWCSASSRRSGGAARTGRVSWWSSCTDNVVAADRGVRRRARGGGRRRLVRPDRRARRGDPLHLGVPGHCGWASVRSRSTSWSRSWSRVSCATGSGTAPGASCTGSPTSAGRSQCSTVWAPGVTPAPGGARRHRGLHRRGCWWPLRSASAPRSPAARARVGRPRRAGRPARPPRGVAGVGSVGRRMGSPRVGTPEPVLAGGERVRRARPPRVRCRPVRRTTVPATTAPASTQPARVFGSRPASARRPGHLPPERSRIADGYYTISLWAPRLRAPPDTLEVES